MFAAVRGAVLLRLASRSEVLVLVKVGLQRFVF